jgi:hypothetical protein
MGIDYLEALAFVQHIVISLVSAWISVQLVSGKMPVADSCSSRNRKKTEACSCGKKNKLNPFGGFVFPSLLQGDYTTTLFCCGVGCFPWLAHLLHKLCHRNKSIRA